MRVALPTLLGVVVCQLLPHARAVRTATVAPTLAARVVPGITSWYVPSTLTVPQINLLVPVLMEAVRIGCMFAPVAMIVGATLARVFPCATQVPWHLRRATEMEIVGRAKVCPATVVKENVARFRHRCVRMSMNAVRITTNPPLARAAALAFSAIPIVVYSLAPQWLLARRPQIVALGTHLLHPCLPEFAQLNNVGMHPVMWLVACTCMFSDACGNVLRAFFLI